MIEYGIHAITFEAVNKKGKNAAKSELKQIENLIAFLEIMTRIYDQLDEQLHAGSFFYINIGTSKFVSNSVFVYPTALVFVGFLVPVLVQIARNEKIDLFSLQFVISVYASAAYMISLPSVMPNGSG